jgi:nickel-type superoxide dismutase maturation protease
MRTVRNSEPAGGRGRSPRVWLAAAGLALYGVTLAVNRSLIEVRGTSMEPSLWPGDRLLTVPVWRARLRPGQVVVVVDPHDPEHLVVKRLHHLGVGEVEVRGDNAGASTDSRAWGPLPLRAVRRVAIARWPDVRTPLHRTAPPHR